MENKTDLKNFVLNFNAETKDSNKVKIDELKKLLKANKAILVDVRFKDEYDFYNSPFATNIPLSELPNNLNNLDKSKLIITICRTRDRAIMAMLYLLSEGYNAKYSVDGMSGIDQ
ncbi:MAG: rhodanese-like domain-containing protein [Ichthyobacteriaceae bacterium]|nr:rhodanese-like domain-containing protein [Ichthyobacteriaceae bacterium]